MQIVFDESKNAANQDKHGVSLGLANSMEWDEMLSWPDLRKDYGERRMAGLAPIGDRLFFVAFVDRPADAPTERRVISLRKANLREVNRYAKDS